jgi:hypothetical protein
MKGIIALAGVALGLSLAACSGTPHSTAAPAKSHKTSPAPSVVPSSAPPTANPSGTGSGSCDYTLSTSPYKPDYLTAEVDLTNTGNIGTVVRVTVKWPQEGFAPIRSTKTVRTAAGSSNVPVHFSVNAGSTASGSNIIDNLQSWEQGHNYPSDDCSYKLTIIRSYGPVQGS